jgi:hypothetical protein
MNTDERRGAAVRLLRDAALTMAAVLLAWAAFDDITTDNATSFKVEYGGLILCAAWLLVLAVRLIRIGRPALGGISLAALTAAAWGQRAVGPGAVPDPGPQYFAIMFAFAWFAILSMILLALGWRAHPERQSTAAL